MKLYYDRASSGWAGKGIELNFAVLVVVLGCLAEDRKSVVFAPAIVILAQLRSVVL